MATVETEQLVIDGLPVKDREVRIKGLIAVPADMIDEVLGGEEIDVRVIARLSRRTQGFAINQWGDDEASVSLTLEVNQTKRVKRVDPELTVERRAEKVAERDAEREEEKRRFDAEQAEWRRIAEAEQKEHDESQAKGGELAERRRKAQQEEAPEPAGDPADPRAGGDPDPEPA